jgi:hypothetical protein
VDTFRFGAQIIRTKVKLMVPRAGAPEIVDVTAAMHEPSVGHEVLDDVFDAMADAFDGSDA